MSGSCSTAATRGGLRIGRAASSPCGAEVFGGSSTQAQQQTAASGVNIQSSCWGGVVPVIYGQTRLTGNLIWYGDFQAIAVQSSSGNGGKGGDSGHGSTTYDYKASFIFALGE